MVRPRQVSDDEILATARRCFVAHGSQMSLAVIAAELGISSPALFNRFKNKRELMIAALAPPPVPEWVSDLEQGPDNRPFEVQLKELAEHIAGFFEEMSPRMVVLRTSGISPEMRGLLDELNATLVRTSICGLGQVALGPLMSRIRRCAGDQVGIATAAILVKNDGSVATASVGGSTAISRARCRPW